jgi:uncharacterized membrane protein
MNRRIDPGFAWLLALIAWQWLWHAGLQPPQRLAPAWVAAWFCLPLALPLWLYLRGSRRAGFWSGVLALFYFAFGVMEAWTDARARWLGIVQALLSALLVMVASQPGLRARFRRKPGTAANV